jgi:hypothetical protein
LASYGGLFLFGSSVVVKVVDNPTAAQVAAFFGVSGVVSLYGSLRGAAIEVKGVLIADDPSDLGSLIATIKSYRDGIGRVFVDNYGNQYNNTLMQRYMPAGERVYRVPGGGYAEQYQATLEYLGG